MKRGLVIQPVLDPPGGGSAVAAWMLEALKADHRIALLTWQPPDLAEVNRFYGTSLTATDLETHVVPAAVRRAFARLPRRHLLVRDTYLMRRARRLAPAFDIVISAEDEADLGPRGTSTTHAYRRSGRTSICAGTTRGRRWRAPIGSAPSARLARR